MNTGVGFKPPKQWKRWLKKAGLRNTWDSRLARRYGYYYFKGHGHYWRLAADGLLEMSEPYADFDRWANSVYNRAALDFVKQEHHFVAAVRSLLLCYRINQWKK